MSFTAHSREFLVTTSSVNECQRSAMRTEGTTFRATVRQVAREGGGSEPETLVNHVARCSTRTIHPSSTVAHVRLVIAIAGVVGGTACLGEPRCEETLTCGQAVLDDGSAVRDDGRADEADWQLAPITAPTDTAQVDADASALDAGRDVSRDSYDGGVDDARDLDSPQDARQETAPRCDVTRPPSSDRCVVTSDLAVFVSPSGVDGAAGTKDAPVKTIQGGLQRLQGHIVQAPLHMRRHLSRTRRHNHSCRRARHLRRFRLCHMGLRRREKAALQPSAEIEGLVKGFTLEDAVVTTPDATGPGESSIAVWVSHEQRDHVSSSEYRRRAGAATGARASTE